MNITHLKIKKEKQPLSTAQKTFNRLNNRINKLKKDITGIPAKMDKIRQHQQDVLGPLEEQFFRVKYETIKRLDHMHDFLKLGKRQKETLVEILLDELEEIHGHMDKEDEKYEELQGLHDKYMRQIYSEEELKEMEDNDLRMVKTMAESMLGLNIDGIEDIPEDEIQDFLYQRYEEAMKEEQQQSPPRQERKKIRKPTAKEMEKKQETDASLKTLREIYTDLVKKLHPDREKDEILRQEKTEQMKLVTEAYGKKDLATLLLMQIQWLQHTEKDPMTQPDDVLTRYNNVLKMHIKKLEEEYRILLYRPLPFETTFDMQFLLNVSESRFSYYLADSKREMQERIEEAEYMYASTQTAASLKQYINRAKEKEPDDLDILELLMKGY